MTGSDVQRYPTYSAVPSLGPGPQCCNGVPVYNQICVVTMCVILGVYIGAILLKISTSIDQVQGYHMGRYRQNSVSAPNSNLMGFCRPRYDQGICLVNMQLETCQLMLLFETLSSPN